MMKAKFLFSLLLLLLIAVSVLFKIQIDNNNELKKQLQSRDSLIKKSQVTDSLNCQHTEEYVKTITKYITNDCSILIDKKEVSLSEFIEIYKKQIDENSTLSDSLNTLKRQIELISKKYSISVDTKDNGNQRITSLEARRIDSALILLSVFRDRLKYDSTNHSWLIKK